MFAMHHVTNEFNDIHYKKTYTGYAAYWGKQLLGYIDGKTKSFTGWRTYDDHGCSLVEGFISRWKATEYLLWLNGIWREDYVTPGNPFPKRPINYVEDKNVI